MNGVCPECQKPNPMTNKFCSNCGAPLTSTTGAQEVAFMEEAGPEDIEALLDELEEEYGTLGPTPGKVRLCPKCGKQNLESAWHCIDCGTTLSMKTLTDKEAAQRAEKKSPGASEGKQRTSEEGRIATPRAQQQPSLLAPTELILLHGDEFATTALAAAFLAVEQAGAVQLEVRREQALFGLLKLDRLYVVPGEHAISWPSYSFESQLRRIAASLQSQGRNHVSGIMYDWWRRWRGGKSRDPWGVVRDLVSDGLVSRGLLQKERKPGLKRLLAGSSYVLPAETAALATQQSLEPIRRLLATCRRTRPDVWDLLTEGINKGIGKCEKKDDPFPDCWG